jgi:hypothetical protein
LDEPVISGSEGIVYQYTADIVLPSQSLGLTTADDDQSYGLRVDWCGTLPGAYNGYKHLSVAFSDPMSIAASIVSRNESEIVVEIDSGSQYVITLRDLGTEYLDILGDSSRPSIVTDPQAISAAEVYLYQSRPKPSDNTSAYGKTLEISDWLSGLPSGEEPYDDLTKSFMTILTQVLKG